MILVARIALVALAAADLNGCTTFVCDPLGVSWKRHVHYARSKQLHAVRLQVR